MLRRGQSAAGTHWPDRKPSRTVHTTPHPIPLCRYSQGIEASPMTRRSSVLFRRFRCATAHVTGLVVALLALSAASGGAQGALGAHLVVSTSWLAAHLRDPDLVLLQIGSSDDSAEFCKAHIPGARPVELADISAGMSMPMDMDRTLMLEMLPPDSLRSRLEALGISDHSRIVVYFASDRISPATRTLFTLAYAGLDRSSLLDGGLGAWQRDGRPSASGPAAPVRRGRITSTYRPSLVVDIPWIQAHVGHPGIALIDARQKPFYDGTSKDDGPRRGHIPGAQSLPFEELWHGDNYLLSADSLAARFRAAGVQPGDTVVAYCHIGQRATAVLLAASTLGHPIRLYDGSFQEWGRRPDLPVDNPAGASTGRQ
jgi:thiosulfate/3-mercaptopyruvate sulfurtransferase